MLTKVNHVLSINELPIHHRHHVAIMFKGQFTVYNDEISAFDVEVSALANGPENERERAFDVVSQIQRDEELSKLTKVYMAPLRSHFRVVY